MSQSIELSYQFLAVPPERTIAFEVVMGIYNEIYGNCELGSDFRSGNYESMSPGVTVLYLS